MSVSGRAVPKATGPGVIVMTEIGSYIIYGGNGVCRVTDKRSERLYGKQQTYYILTPVGNPGAVIYVPADNDALLGRMKEIVCPEEIASLIDGLKDEELPWEPDNRARGEMYDAVIARGDRRELLLLIRTVYRRKLTLSEQKKKLGSMDENALKRAEKLINDEFAFALSIPPEEVPDFIRDRLLAG